MTEKKLTRRQEIDMEIEKLAAELAPDCSPVEWAANLYQRQILYDEWLKQPDLPDTDLMKHQPRNKKE